MVGKTPGHDLVPVVKGYMESTAAERSCRMRTAKETFYFVEDVMKMLGLSRSKAYSIIKQFNSELEEQGYFTVPGV